MQPRILIVLVLAGCLIPFAAQISIAQELGKPSINLVDGSTVKANISTIDAAGNVSGNGVPAGLKLQDILAVSTGRKTENATVESFVTIIMLEGGIVKTKNLLLGNEKLTFESQAGIGAMPLQSARAIVWTESQSVKNAIKKPSAEKDIIIVKPGDEEIVLEGLFESVDAERVGINYNGESQKIANEKMIAVVMADLGMSAPKGTSAKVSLVDGSHLVGVITTMADGLLSLKVAGDATVSLKSSSIVDITITSDRLLYLSDSQPLDVEERAVFTIQRTWKRDRSIENNPLSIRIGKSPKTVDFKKGIGAQAFSRLVFANTKEFDRFNATVGIDAETKGRGDCQMTVRGDGIELWSKRIQGSGEPLDVDLDITGIKEVELLVYPGEDFDLGDHADWGEARFLKTK